MCFLFAAECTCVLMCHFVPFIVSLFVTCGGLFSKLTTGFCDCYTLISAHMLWGINIADEITNHIQYYIHLDMDSSLAVTWIEGAFLHGTDFAD